MNRGFTLIEFLIYLALTGLVLTSLVLWVLSLTGVRDKNYVATEVEANSQMINATLAAAVKNADEVVQPVPGASGDILELSSIEPFGFSAFHLEDGVLWQSFPAGDPLAVTSALVEVTEINFSNFTSPFTTRDSVSWQFHLRYRDAPSVDFAYEITRSGAANVRSWQL